MKKTSKIFGAIALSAALAMGTAVPAFAAPEWNDDKDVPQNVEADDLLTKESNNKTTTNGGDLATGETDKDTGKMTTEKNTGASKVRVLSDAGQISATIPIMVYVVADTTGGELLVTPTGNAPRNPGDTGSQFINYGGYRIENYSQDTAIRIAGITVVEENSGTYTWEYTNDSSHLGKGKEAPSGKVGYIELTITPNSESESSATMITLKKDDSQAAFLENASRIDNWSISKAVDTPFGSPDNKTLVPGVIGLKIGGTTSQLKDAQKITLADWTTDAPTVSSDGTISQPGSESAASTADLKIIYTIDMAKTQS